MSLKLKPLDQQTMVITGATSGIGLVTARMAATRRARLVLAARGENALRLLTEEINRSGGEAIYVVADVGKEADVQRLSDQAIEKFGGFDTWVNNAGISIYGNLLDISIEDMRQLMETNFWGVVHGSLIAARHLRTHGGALINIGSTLSDRALPIQGMYSASKHAVKGFTDALRMELEAESAPVSVTLLKPAAIDTPYIQHAKNYLEVEPKNPPPVYAPQVVAEAILRCATHPMRDVFAGAAAKAISALGYYAPRMTDRTMERHMISRQKTKQPALAQSHKGLFEASGELQERGGYAGHVAESCLYTKASVNPAKTTALVVGVGLALGALWSSMQTRKRF